MLEQGHYASIRTPRFSRRWAFDLLWSLAIHKVSLRYKESLFGFGWIFLQPVALTIIFNYIRRIAQIQTGEVPYPLFVAVGLVAWSMTALVVSQSAISVTSYQVLLKRIALPRILLPLSTVVSTLVDLCVMALLFVGLSIYYHYSLPPEALWILFLFPFHLALLIGLSCLISIVHVFLRDIGHALPSLLQLWFFASPVFYPSSMVPLEFREIARWNPMTGLLEGYRYALLLGETPPLDLVVPAILVSLAVLALGWTCFRRLEGIVADML